MTKFFAPAIAISAGFLVLLGYFLPNKTFLSLRLIFVQWAVILAGTAVLVGVINLFSVHTKKITSKGKGKIYSLLLILSLLATLFLGIILGTNSPTMRHLFNAVILPVESSLLAIISVTLIYTGIRLFRHRNDIMAMIFLATALLVMLGTAPLPFITLPFVSEIRNFIVYVLATSGARGILIGVSLGILLTGLRVLLGAERPYGGK